MVYVALLRGVNVGGNRLVSMAGVRNALEAVGLRDVQTYINSGNVIFATRQTSNAALARRVSDAIESSCGLKVEVLIRDRDQMAALVAALPPTWVNDERTRCDVMFLFPEIDKPAVLEEFPANDALEDLSYTKGAVVWRIDRADLNKSRMTKLVGTALYKRLTVRNANTVRKLHELVALLD